MRTKTRTNASDGKSSTGHNGNPCDNHYLRTIRDWRIHWLCNIKGTFKRKVIEIVFIEKRDKQCV